MTSTMRPSHASSSAASSSPTPTTRAVRRIVDELDPSRLHVVVTLRPLARIIPSMWQQNVQAGKRQSLDRWLRTLFPEPGEAPNASFWTLHRHDELVRRWASVVGTANVTAIVVEERDHAYVLRVVRVAPRPAAGHPRAGARPRQPIADLRRGGGRPRVRRCVPDGTATTGRSTPDVMRYGAAQHMKGREPGPSEAPIELPAWAIPRIAETGREHRRSASRRRGSR